MITEYTGWRRDKPGLGVWSGKGKTAFAGIGHSDVDRRWDGKDMKTTLGMKAIQACERALADAGVKPEDVDGLLCCPDNGDGSGGPAGRWAPRPYFAPPYDSEAGLSIVTSEWLLQNMPRLKNVQSPRPRLRGSPKWSAWPPRPSWTASAIPASSSTPWATWRAATAREGKGPSTTR